jgi:predicted HTH transcriptional regulator
MDQDDFMLPWGRDGLASLITDLISRGEGPKVDMKRQLDLVTAAQKGELLKDIQAMANMFDAAHKNHGFIVIGVDGGKLVPVSFASNEDHTQAQIDELVKNYIGPFIQTKLFVFGEPGAQYAVLVIPPTRNAPHAFVREIERFKQGDTFVRRGTTTQKALPEDFARFFRLHLDEHAYQQQVEIRELRARVRALESSAAAPKKAIAEAQPEP